MGGTCSIDLGTSPPVKYIAPVSSPQSGNNANVDATENNTAWKQPPSVEGGENGLAAAPPPPATSFDAQPKLETEAETEQKLNDAASSDAAELAPDTLSSILSNLPSSTCSTSQRIIVGQLSSSCLHSYTGLGRSWGVLCSDSSFNVGSNRSVFEFIVLSAPLGSCFIVGVSPSETAMQCLPGSAAAGPSATGWTPSTGHVRRGGKVAQQKIPIMLQPKDRVTLTWMTSAPAPAEEASSFSSPSSSSSSNLKIELNDGLVALIEDGLDGLELCPTIALIGGASILCAAQPVAEEEGGEKTAVRSELDRAATSFLASQASESAQASELLRSHRRKQSKQARSAAGSDGNGDAWLSVESLKESRLKSIRDAQRMKMLEEARIQAAQRKAAQEATIASLDARMNEAGANERVALQAQRTKLIVDFEALEAEHAAKLTASEEARARSLEQAELLRAEGRRIEMEEGQRVRRRIFTLQRMTIKYLECPARRAVRVWRKCYQRKLQRKMRNANANADADANANENANENENGTESATNAQPVESNPTEEQEAKEANKSAEEKQQSNADQNNNNNNNNNSKLAVDSLDLKRSSGAGALNRPGALPPLKPSSALPPLKMKGGPGGRSPQVSPALLASPGIQPATSSSLSQPPLLPTPSPSASPSESSPIVVVAPAPPPPGLSARPPPKTTQLGSDIWLDQFDLVGGGGGDSNDNLQLKRFEFVVRNESTTRFILSMDFSKCTGLELGGDAVQECVVSAFESKVVASLAQVDPSKGYWMKYQYSWKELPLSPEEIQACIETEEEERRKDIASMSEYGLSQSFPALPPEEGAPRNSSWVEAMRLVEETLPEEVAFVDTSFPPTMQSVFSGANDALATSNNGDEENASNCVLDPSIRQHLSWRRLFDFLPPGTTPTIFGGPSAEGGLRDWGGTGGGAADPNDIQQGKLGDCWFCSALSALAECPENCTRLFPAEQKVNAKGVYAVRICVTGQWQEILLDDWFPCVRDKGPIFTRSKWQESQKHYGLWVLLAEKAYAKLHGGYEKLIFGQPHHALADLTGYPVRALELNYASSKYLLENDAELLWQYIVEWAGQDLSCCALTVGRENATDSDHERLQKAGLVPGYAYSLLHAVQVPDEFPSSPGARLIQLRNPWGTGEWSGDWSDRSDKWVADLKDLFNQHAIHEADDGLFVMELGDFLQYFVTVSCCFIRSPSQRPWLESRYSARFEPWDITEEVGEGAEAHQTTRQQILALEAYKLQVSEESDVWAAIYQPDARLPYASPLIDQGILIARLNGEGGEEEVIVEEVVADTSIESQRQSNVHAKLQPGSYLILPYTTGNKMRMRQCESRPYNVAIFTDVESTHSSLSTMPVTVELVSDAVKALLRSKGKVDVIGKEGVVEMYQLRFGASHLYACGISSEAPRGYRVTLDTSSSRNVVSSSQMSPPSSVSEDEGEGDGSGSGGSSGDEGGSNSMVVTRSIEPGCMSIFHWLIPLDARKPVWYYVNYTFKRLPEPATEADVAADADAEAQSTEPDPDPALTSEPLPEEEPAPPADGDACAELE